MLSVILCTYNRGRITCVNVSPRCGPEHSGTTVERRGGNQSDEPIAERVDLSWHPAARMFERNLVSPRPACAAYVRRGGPTSLRG